MDFFTSGELKAGLFPKFCYFFFAHSGVVILGIKDIDCDNTEFGCCEIREISCESCVREGDSYSFYKYIEERNIGHWTLNIEKENEEGDNCPTIEEMILEISDEKSTFKPTILIV